jgi:hypothetical protein
LSFLTFITDALKTCIGDVHTIEKYISKLYNLLTKNKSGTASINPSSWENREQINDLQCQVISTKKHNDKTFS